MNEKMFDTASKILLTKGGNLSDKTVFAAKSVLVGGMNLEEVTTYIPSKNRTMAKISINSTIEKITLIVNELRKPRYTTNENLFDRAVGYLFICTNTNPSTQVIAATKANIIYGMTISDAMRLADMNEASRNSIYMFKEKIEAVIELIKSNYDKVI